MAELSRLENMNSVPFAFRYDAGVARPQIKRLAGHRIADNPQPAGDDIEDFVPIGVNLSAVGCVPIHRNNAGRHTCNPFGRAGLALPGGYRQIRVYIE